MTSPKLNITYPRDDSDPNFRYKMDWLQIIAARKTTTLMNLTVIAAALYRDPHELFEFINIELKIHQRTKAEGGNFLLKGEHSMETLTDIIFEYIRMFVLCHCGLPETAYNLKIEVETSLLQNSSEFKNNKTSKGKGKGKVQSSNELLLERRCVGCSGVTLCPSKHPLTKLILKDMCISSGEIPSHNFGLTSQHADLNLCFKTDSPCSVDPLDTDPEFDLFHMLPYVGITDKKDRRAFARSLVNNKATNSERKIEDLVKHGDRSSFCALIGDIIGDLNQASIIYNSIAKKK